MSDAAPYVPPPPPQGLARLDAKGKRSPTGRKDGEGRALWKAFTADGKYILRPDELRYLEDACKLADRAQALEREAADRPSTVRGSTGQPVINPLLAEERQCRTAIGQLLSKIKMPDDPGNDEAAGQGNTRATGARAAAQSRWGKT